MRQIEKNMSHALLLHLIFSGLSVPIFGIAFIYTMYWIAFGIFPIYLILVFTFGIVFVFKPFRTRHIGLLVVSIWSAWSGLVGIVIGSQFVFDYNGRLSNDFEVLMFYGSIMILLAAIVSIVFAGRRIYQLRQQTDATLEQSSPSLQSQQMSIVLNAVTTILTLVLVALVIGSQVAYGVLSALCIIALFVVWVVFYIVSIVIPFRRLRKQ